MNENKFLIVDNEPEKPNGTLKMAYGGNSADNASSRSYRMERGTPFLRGGKLVYATPQFKGLTLYSPVSNNVQFTPTTTTPTQAQWPSKTK